jgi:hypothetical protein
MSVLYTLQTVLKRIGTVAIVCGLPLTLTGFAQSSSSSYSSSTYTETAFSPQYGNGQYGNQSYYGNPPSNNHRAPRYTGHSWTDHLILEGGGGVTPAVGNTQNFANTGYNVLLGVGAKFNERLSVLAEWNFNRMGVPHTLAGIIAGVPDGNEHLWTIDVNPKINLIHSGALNVYAIGGGGFSRALVNYTAPVIFNCYDYYFGPYPCSGSITVAHTSSNQGNFDIGGGVEWRLNPYERGSLFLETRYLRMFTPSGLPPGGDASLLPVTFGYRW